MADPKSLKQWASEEEAEHTENPKGAKGGGGGKPPQAKEQPEAEEGGEEQEQEGELNEELVSLLNDNLEVLEDALDNLPGEVLSSPDAEMDEDTSNTVNGLLDQLGDETREMVRGLPWEDALATADAVEGVSEPQLLGGLVFRMGQVA